MKVYLFYYKKELYGFTVTKRRRKQFLDERGTGKIKEKIVKMTDDEYSEFSYEFKMKMLVEIPLTNAGKHVTLIGTYEEEDKLQNKHDTMLDTSEDCIRAIYKLPLKNDIKELLLEMVTARNMVYESDLNTFDMFVDLFEDTFTQH